MIVEPGLVIGVHAFANTHQGISYVTDSAYMVFMASDTHSSIAWQPGVLHKSHLQPRSPAIEYRRPSLGVQISPFLVTEGNHIVFITEISMNIISAMILPGRCFQLSES